MRREQRMYRSAGNTIDKSVVHNSNLALHPKSYENVSPKQSENKQSAQQRQKESRRVRLNTSTVRSSIVSIHLLDTATGEIFTCGSGCVVDRTRGLVITGDQVLRQLSFLQAVPSSRSITILIKIKNPPSKTIAQGPCRSYFTAQPMMYYSVKNKELCILRLGEYVDLSPSNDHKVTEVRTVKKKTAISLMKSFKAWCRRCKANKSPKRDTLPVPLVLKPISRIQLSSLTEIRIAEEIDINDPNLTLIPGYRRIPLRVSSGMVEVKISETEVSSRTSTSPCFLAETKLPLDIKTVGSAFINGDGVMVGIVCNYVPAETLFAFACSAAYYIAGPKLIKTLLEKAQSKCDQK